MKHYIRTILLTGAIAVNSDDVNIEAAVICGVACSGFVIIKDDKN